MTYNVSSGTLSLYTTTTTYLLSVNGSLHSYAAIIIWMHLSYVLNE